MSTPFLTYDLTQSREFAVFDLRPPIIVSIFSNDLFTVSLYTSQSINVNFEPASVLW